MRIQHNIMAMNAYRNYNTNTSALSKNLEKLSSGYKINRAGDDAAGLAISEKMRAQITGLNAASKNVKDGISLVKTAEGAMQEIQDMLNRMDYLATQSANGTYDSSVDRTNLQKEVDALRTEIDRIADSANFNGIKLLDGSQAGTKAQAAWTEELSAGEFNGTDRILNSTATGAAVQNSGNIVFDSYAGTATKGSFSIDFSDVDFSFTMGSKAMMATGAGSFALNTASQVALGTLTVTIGSVTVKVTASCFGAAVKATASKGVITGSITASAVGQAILVALARTTKTGATAGATSAKINLNGVTWNVKQSGGKLTFTQNDIPKNADEAKMNFDVKISHTAAAAPSSGVALKIDDTKLQDGVTPIKVAVPKGATKGAEAVFEIKEDDIRDGAKISIGTKTYTLKLGANSAVTATGSTVIDLSSFEKGAEGLLNTAIAKLVKAAGSSVNVNVTKPDGTATTVSFKISAASKGIALMRATAPASSAQCYFKDKASFKDVFKVSYGSTKIDHAAVEESGGLKLQIGDTSDEYNQMGVHIGNMHVKAMGYELDSKGNITKTGKSIADIDISSQQGAADAINTIKNAINYVSGIRGDLGAVQNRLEHTQNNLSVMAENIQDAESTIRDTDVAEEMMSYVKNNILVQSAQAMLAQANQVPQGVLQLLG